tara:strand:- start:26048 stop:26167 length:120 start_codon:yes stop_codon:yes gene_type:complete
MYTDQTLPNQEKINSVKDKVLQEVEKGINKLDEISKNND